MHWAVAMKQQSCGGFFGFQRATSEPAGKEGNLQHDIWCLVTNTWANRVVIVYCVITIYLTPAKVGQSTFALQFCPCASAPNPASLFVASLLLAIYLLLFIILPVVLYLYLIILLWFQVHSGCSVLSCSVSSNYSIIECYSVLILEMCSRYFNLYYINYPVSQ